MGVKEIISKWQNYGFLDGLNEIQISNVGKSMEIIRNKLKNQINDDHFDTLMFPVVRCIIQEQTTLLSNKILKELNNTIFNSFLTWYKTERIELINKSNPLHSDIEVLVVKAFINEFISNLI